MKNDGFKKILVIRFSSLGDVILTTPLLKALRQKYPDSEINYLTKKEYSAALKNNPHISRIIETDDNLDFAGLKELKKQIKQTGYDLVIDAHNNLRTFYIRMFLNCKKLKFKKYSFRKFILVKLKINMMKDLPPITERYCRIIGESAPGLPEIFTDDAAKQNAERILNELNVPKGKKLICIVPTSKHFTKTYPAEYYSELINKFDPAQYAFLLTGKGADKTNIDKIKSKTGENVFDLCDKLNLLELAEVMKKSSLVISGDTGPMHIAESVIVPLIMLAGSSVREFGFYAQSKNSVVLENNTLKCRPCSHIGRDSCPLVHFKCMIEINPDIVYNETEKLFK